MTPRTMSALLSIPVLMLAATGCATTRPTRAPAPPAEELSRQGIAFSPDGRRIAFKAVRGDQEFIVLHAQGRSREGRPYDAVRDPEFTPDGRSLVYVARRGDHEILVRDEEEGPAYDFISAIVFSPDGRRTAYLAGLAAKSLLIIDGERAAHEPDASVFPVFSPDGASIAYAGARKDAHGKRRVFAVLNGKAGKEYDQIINRLQFTPEGSKLLYVAEADKRRTLVTGEAEGPWYSNVFFPIFSPDGRATATVVTTGKASRVLVNGIAGPELDCCVSDAELRFSPDGSLLAYPAQLPGEQKSRVIVNGKPSERAYASISELLFSRDSRQIAYRAQETPAGKTRESFVVLNGSEGKRFETIDALRFDAHDRLLYVGKRSGQARLVVQGPAAPPREGPLYDEIDALTLDPTGTVAAYRAKRGRASLLVTGRDESPLYEQVSPPLFGLDARPAYWAVRRGRAFVVKNGREGEPHDEIHELRFTPNGQSLLYVASQGSRTRLVLDEQEIGSFEGVGEFGTPKKYWKGTEKLIPVQAGQVRTLVARGEYRFQLDGRTLYRYEDGIGGQVSLDFQGRFESVDVFLLGNYAGDGCPSQTVLIAIPADGLAFVSEPFGNCSSPSAMVTPDGLRIAFPPHEKPHETSPSETWLFHKGTLKRSD